MRTKFLALLCGIIAPLACFASNEGVPVYYSSTSRMNANRNAFQKYQKQGYTQYVGNTGKKQVLGSRQYAYQVPRQQYSTNTTYSAYGILPSS